MGSFTKTVFVLNQGIPPLGSKPPQKYRDIYCLLCVRFFAKIPDCMSTYSPQNKIEKEDIPVDMQHWLVKILLLCFEN